MHIFDTPTRTGDNREIILPSSNIYSNPIMNDPARDTRRIDLVPYNGFDDTSSAGQDADRGGLCLGRLHPHGTPAPVVSTAKPAGSRVNLNIRPWV